MSISSLYLNYKLNFTLKGRIVELDSTTIRLVYDKKIQKSDWREKNYHNYLNNIKDTYYFAQDRRCAFCRTRVRIGAYWEEIEHIVAQSKVGAWIYYPKNLVIACKPCNSLKNADETRSNITSKYFPLHSNGFTVFNPHFDKWSDHFKIEKGIFLTAKTNTKGPNTYKKYHLFRYHIAIAYSEELRFSKKKTYRRLTHKLTDNTLTTEQILGIQEGISYIIKLKKYGRPNK